MQHSSHKIDKDAAIRAHKLYKANSGFQPKISSTKSNHSSRNSHGPIFSTVLKTAAEKRVQVAKINALKAEIAAGDFRSDKQDDWSYPENISSHGMSGFRRKYRKKILAQNDEVTAAIVNRELNVIKAEHLAEGDLNMVVSRLVKKVRKTSADSKSDENKIVTKAKKGPSLSEINY